MPYFVYKVFADRQLEPVETFDNYRDAKALVRSMRASLVPGDQHVPRLIFATSVSEAERLLAEVREPRPLGEDG